MTKLLKYEIKESAPKFVPIIIGILVLSIVLWTFSTVVVKDETDFSVMDSGVTVGNIAIEQENNMADGVLGVVVGIAMVVIGTACAVIYATSMCTNYSDDLYTHHGELKFTRPVSTWEYLLSKYINTTFWTVLITGVSILANVIMIYIFIKVIDVPEKYVTLNLGHFSILRDLAVLVSLSLLWCGTMYTSITLDKIVRSGGKQPILGVGLGIFLFFFSLNELIRFGIKTPIFSSFSTTFISGALMVTAIGFGITFYLLDKKLDL